MSGLPPSASVANAAENGKLIAPSALRNVSAIVGLLQEIAPSGGRALEIASGTGQHALAFATAMTHIDWHPTEIAPDRITSIDAYAAQAQLKNLHPAQQLDASKAGWSTLHTPYDLIYLGNLLHLIPMTTAAAVIAQAAKALVPSGIFTIYGPFSRSGALTSVGDEKFDAQLRHADPDIGYKDDVWIKQLLTAAGLRVTLIQEMPANNLAFIAKREPS